MPVISTLGAASSRGFGEFAQSTAANYIEDVFSTYLYTGTSASQTITNGIDLSTKGGMVWTKSRSAAYNHQIYDTDRGATKLINPNLTDAQANAATGLTNFTSSGYAIGSNIALNESGNTYASWTFRKQPKFFDVVTYTGNGVAGRTISHNLGSVPGMIIIKSTNLTENWAVYHRSNGNTKYQFLNTTAAAATSSNFWNNTTPTSTNFTLGNDASVNDNGSSYVAYLFAHNAGGFGLDGTQNVISCGSFTTDGSGNASVTLGYEPQFILIKATGITSNWFMFDNMRGMPVSTSTNSPTLYPNLSNAEGSGYPFQISATGFGISNAGLSRDYIYMAIRRGPMKVPTDATTVFSPAIYTGDNVDGRLISSGFPVDSAIIDPRNGYATPGGPNWFSRLIGNGYFLQTAQTNAESNGSSNSNGIMGQDGITVSRTGTNVWSNVASNTYVSWFLKRAPSFMDVVCYTGTGSTTTFSHNLTSVPEFMIIKARSSGVQNWGVYAAPLGNTYNLLFDKDLAQRTDNYWNNTSPTSSVFTVRGGTYVNTSGVTYVAYLFATCPGVSKVGSYTGTGATQTISCGFTGGARYVLIKRTDSTGDWWVWDTARGMVAGTDPRLAYNSTAAETNANWVYTTTGGFQIVTSDATVNANGGSYIFLAIS